MKYHKGDIIANPWIPSMVNGNRNYWKYFVFTSKGRDTISGFSLSHSQRMFEKQTIYTNGASPSNPAREFKIVGHTKILDEFKNELDDIIDKDAEAEK